ncbi:hypothetical protein N0V90_001298 [Kalmusia sp. IMI 367209]|nr:hypothetical protein N0V90_001298 [Kalmusia sp. IMI 367209]
MLNTLANHGFLPHDGRNFDLNTVQGALKTALNISNDIALGLHEEALATNPEKNATTWGLDTLGNHNVLEHDASLSRSDLYFTNDSVTFNATVFAQTQKWWTTDLITIQQAADARLARLLDSAKYNRLFALSENAGNFSYGEGAAYLMVFGDRKEGFAKKDQVTYLFEGNSDMQPENERLPVELGWKTPSPEIVPDDLANMRNNLVDATAFKVGEMKKRGLDVVGFSFGR